MNPYGASASRKKRCGAVGAGVVGAERRSGGGDGAAQPRPVARTQVGIVLQLIRPSNLYGPSQTKHAAGQGHGLELRQHGQRENREAVIYCWLRRKNKFPAEGVMLMKSFVPSLETVPPLGVQLVVVKSGFCCKVQPAEGYGQETFKPLPDCVMASCSIVGVAIKPFAAPLLSS